MADAILTEALRRVAAEAAIRLTSLVATGEELPYDVAENEGEHTFYRYVPLTSRFIREHAGELRSLPAFGPACSAIDAAGVAASYLEARGEGVPEDAVERADQMVVAFIARLWDGSAEFTIDKPRLDAALRELRVEVRDISEAEVLVAPLVGLQMPSVRLELPSGVRIVRADTVDVPAEAIRSEGMQRKAWDPQFLALAEREQGPTGAAPAMQLLRDLVSVLRLFKEGGVGLGPHAFTPTGEGTWRRIATGVPAPRSGGYKLSDLEAEELAAFARRLEARPDPDGALAWAVARFEMGCGRPIALEGLSDHLLAMRALFEGSGPVGANLPMRVAALLAEPPERPVAYEKLQAAFELERAMMGGNDFDLGNATGLAAWLEDAARTIVCGAALGEHGSDVAASADETLVATGLEAGDGSVEQRGDESEWEGPVDEDSAAAGDPTPSEAELTAEAGPDPDEIRITARNAAARELTPEAEPDPAAEPATAEEAIAGDDRYQDGIYFDAKFEQTGPQQGGHHRDTPASEAEDVSRFDEEGEHDEDEEATVTPSTAHDWLSEVTDAVDGETMEWPAVVRERSGEEPEWRQGAERSEPLEEPRVRHLFPVPEDSDWEVGELEYDRSRTGV